MTEAERAEAIAAIDGTSKAIVEMTDVGLNVVQLLDADGRSELGDRLMQAIRWWLDSWERYLKGEEQKDVVFDHYRVVSNLMDEAQGHFFRPVDES